MEDRFKFRVWDKRISEMRAIWSITPFNAIASDLKTQNIVIPHNDCEIMQCTGLKDKNGKLIYFDDLVKLPWGEIGIVKAENKGENYGKVVLRNIANKKNIDVVCLFDYMNKCEVIGNIYENPELLKENKGE